MIKYKVNEVDENKWTEVYNTTEMKSPFSN